MLINSLICLSVFGLDKNKALSSTVCEWKERGIGGWGGYSWLEYRSFSTLCMWRRRKWCTCGGNARHHHMRSGQAGVGHMSVQSGW